MSNPYNIDYYEEKRIEQYIDSYLDERIQDHKDFEAWFTDFMTSKYTLADIISALNTTIRRDYESLVRFYFDDFFVWFREKRSKEFNEIMDKLVNEAIESDKPEYNREG